VDRLACVEAPALPLQLLLRAHPDWAQEPVAVVDQETPHGVVLWVNERARAAGILPGLRYSAALGLCGALRAAAVDAATQTAGVRVLLELLLRYSPVVEPHAHDPGVLWLDATGLHRLFRSATAWGEAIRTTLQEARFVAAVVVGFSRFGVHAVAKALAGRRVLVFADAAREHAAAQRVPLDRLLLPPRAREALDQLGVRTVAQLVRLPVAGVRRRFGDEVWQLHQEASGSVNLPLRPHRPPAPPQGAFDLDLPEADFTRLLFLLKQLCDPLLAVLAQNGQALTELSVELQFERGEPLRESVRPAAPTLDAVQILELLQLRLQARPFACGVTRLSVTLHGVPATRAQLLLFADKPRRDLAAGARAFARLRAAFGDQAVVRAVLREGHLPEACFGWEPLEAPVLPEPGVGQSLSLVRRVFARPTPLARNSEGPDGWLLRGPESGPVVGLRGPYRLSGGWWRVEIQRDYYFAQMHSGALLWIYYDRRRRQWFLQGEVS
jgi:protein ImuB